MKLQVSQLIVRYLERLGIEYIFGMPGAHILPVYDALYDSSVEAILAKHEQGAAFMAGGYARASGRISACITTAGPGATNLVTGVANAYADKLPVLLITGEAPTYIFGKGGLQESSGEGGSIDQVTLFKSITRYNKIIERTDYLAQVLNQATKILLSDTPGPVLLSLPYNVQKEMVDESVLDAIRTERPVSVTDRASPAVAELAQLLKDSRSPVFVAGYGCIRSGAQEILTRLSSSLNIPVTSSLKGKGVISEQSELSLGSLGVTSSGIAYQYIVEQADLVVFLGAGFNERTSYLWDSKLLEGKKIAQIDIDPEQLEKVFHADAAIRGDIRSVLTELHRHCQESGVEKKSLDAIRKFTTPAEREQKGDYILFQEGFALVEKLFARLEEEFSEDAVFFDDNIIFAQNFFNVSSENRYHPNSGISSLGHAVPAAIGARFAMGRPTFAILGDGGFQMCCMEIMTAVNYGIPLNVILFNNSTMGLIRKNQQQHYDGRFTNCDFINPDYGKLATSFGIHYKRVTRETDLDDLFSNYDLRGSINLIDIPLDKNIFPNYSSKR